MIEFFIPGLPIAKARPKFAVIKGVARAYTPAKTKAYENMVAIYGRKAIAKPLNGPLVIELAFILPVAPSTSKKRTAELLNGPHIQKPDLTNLVKSVEDGLNGIAYLDDAQIWKISATKTYSENIGVMVKIIF